MNALKIIAGAAMLVALVAAPAHAQKGKFSDKAEIDRLRAEVARVRADLDAALKDIAALKAALGGKAVTPEEAPFYQGRSAARWLEQLKDADPNFRADAVKAINALAQQKKDLAPVLLKLMKDDSDGIVRGYAAQGVARLGDEMVPKLIEMLKDKQSIEGQRSAANALRDLGPKAKPAVPVLIDWLKGDNLSLRHYGLTTLTKIGLEAKAAIPALRDLFDVSFADAKAEIAAPKEPAKRAKGGGFGVRDDDHLGRGSLPRRCVDALLAIDDTIPAKVTTHIAEMNRRSYRDADLQPMFEDIQRILQEHYPRKK